MLSSTSKQPTPNGSSVAGIDRVRPLEHVNLGDLAKVLPADEFSRYIILTQKPLPARIVRITEEA